MPDSPSLDVGKPLGKVSMPIRGNLSSMDKPFQQEFSDIKPGSMPNDVFGRIKRVREAIAFNRVGV